MRRDECQRKRKRKEELSTLNAETEKKKIQRVEEEPRRETENKLEKTEREFVKGGEGEGRPQEQFGNTKGSRKIASGRIDKKKQKIRENSEKEKTKQRKFIEDWLKLDRDQAEQKRELEIKGAEPLKKKKEEKTETEKVYRKEKGSETLTVRVKSIEKERKVRKVQSEVEKNSNMLRIAEMFGGTLKQKVEREKIEKQEKVELDRHN